MVTQKLIEIGAVLRGRPSASHVAVVHHTDKAGTTWAVEGRPGGVGWRDATAYLNTRSTITSAGQQKTDAQRAMVTKIDYGS